MVVHGILDGIAYAPSMNAATVIGTENARVLFMALVERCVISTVRASWKKIRDKQ